MTWCVHHQLRPGLISYDVHHALHLASYVRLGYRAHTMRGGGHGYGKTRTMRGGGQIFSEQKLLITPGSTRRGHVRSCDSADSVPEALLGSLVIAKFADFAISIFPSRNTLRLNTFPIQ